MQPRRKYALSDYTVEYRSKGWYFGRQFQDPRRYRGPYTSIASVTLSIARELRKEVERRDGGMKGRAPAERGANAAPL